MKNFIEEKLKKSYVTKGFLSSGENPSQNAVTMYSVYLSNLPDGWDEKVIYKPSVDKVREHVKAENAEATNTFWQLILTVRDQVNKELESARKAELIGAALQAEVTLFADGELAAHLNRVASELRFVLLCSKVSIAASASAGADAKATEIDGLAISVSATAGKKCERCWHYTDDVGSNAQHPDICGRCVTNVDGDGEQRQFA